jgi:hypothetical protein
MRGAVVIFSAELNGRKRQVRRRAGAERCGVGLLGRFWLEQRRVFRVSGSDDVVGRNLAAEAGSS